MTSAARCLAVSVGLWRCSWRFIGLQLVCFLAAALPLVAGTVPKSAVAASDPIRFIDDAGQALQLSAPARRIVSLSPHITELLFFVGAGPQIVGVAKASDYPAEAARLPVVATHNDVNLEAVVRLKPDAIIVWGRGAANPRIDKLKSLGYRVIYSDPQTPAAIADNMQWMAQLAGTESQAHAAIEQWRTRLSHLESQLASGAEPRSDDLTVFYQVWDRPLMTVNRRHLISQAIRLCGGKTLFADLPLATPTVSVEAVVRGNPDLILYTDDAYRRLDWGKAWMNWRSVRAVKSNQVYALPPDLLVRAGPRFLDGVERVCDVMQRAKEVR